MPVLTQNPLEEILKLLQGNNTIEIFATSVYLAAYEENIIPCPLDSLIKLLNLNSTLKRLNLSNPNFQPIPNFDNNINNIYNNDMDNRIMNSTLTHLYLSDKSETHTVDNQIIRLWKGISALVETNFVWELTEETEFIVKEHFPSLKEIKIATDSNEEYIQRLIRLNSKSLVKLIIPYAYDVVESMSHNNSLTSLEFFDHIDEVKLNLNVINLIRCNHPTLSSIHIARDNFQIIFRDLVDALIQNNHLKKFVIQTCPFGTDVTEFFNGVVRLLNENHTLQHISVPINFIIYKHFDKTHLVSFKNALAQNSSIISMKFIRILSDTPENEKEIKRIQNQHLIL
ncbi:Mitochondrial RNA helicase [Tieghemostelium lacteum]|uniref:Mitochondrial RNA helicase n=1 Tax=Tieghemostelium lacteum TaxID=361077 RepID=A0A152A0J2_TIELA|nr:Mitochondrial RNA helicase [Tieghemostelium lacteum]|eukprot:KYQ99729.1 Mitochondrial RNA helicase [Tieghemostelium lacteum]